MFSIFHGLFTVFAAVANKIGNNVSDNNARDAAVKDGNLTYYSKDGVRLVSNNRLVCTKYIGNHKCIVDLYTGKVYHDISEARNNKYVEEYKSDAKKRGLDTYRNIEDCRKYAPGTNGMVSTLEHDIETGEPVIKIYINKLGYLMSLKTGKLIRIDNFGEKFVTENRVDSINFHKYYNFYIPKTSEDVIHIFNERQEELKRNPLYNKDYKWMAEVYYIKPTLVSDHRPIKIYMDNIGRIVYDGENHDREQELRNEGLPQFVKTVDLFYDHNSVLNDIVFPRR